jgi:hypothetical protein
MVAVTERCAVVGARAPLVERVTGKPVMSGRCGEPTGQDRDRRRDGSAGASRTRCIQTE